MAALIVFHVQNPAGQPIANADIKAQSPNGPWEGITNACGDFVATLAPGHYDLTITANGYAQRLLPADLANCGVITIGLEQSSLPVPTRDQILTIKQSFQGLMVNTPTYGPLAWFDPAIAWIGPEDRKAVYAAKHAAGDTHMSVAVSGQYKERGTPYFDIVGKDFTHDWQGLTTLLNEVISNGFYVLLHCAGDGAWSDRNGGYNDPVGLTYGWPWLMDNFRNIVAHTGLQSPWIVYVAGFDGCYPTWSPQQSFDWFKRARSVVGPSGYLGFEMGLSASGGAYSHFGGGTADYRRFEVASNDLWLQEWHDSPQGDDLWQTAARMLGPAYRRPADQPAGDDLHPPFYLAPGTPRGPYYTAAWEWRAFQFTHGQQGGTTPESIAQDRQRLKAIGYTSVG